MSPSSQVLVARHAMATRFEIILNGENPVALRAAGEEALDEVDRVEAQLSLYRPGSEVSRLNAEAHHRPVRVTPGLFNLLEHARALTDETDGAFDLTIAPLVRCWGFMDGKGALPEAAALDDARACVGVRHVELDPENLTARFTRPGVMLDFGAIGKGFAIDRAVALLREAGISSALMHGGTSTSVAIGRQPDGDAWKVAIRSPSLEDKQPLVVVALENESLSVSAVWGRMFQAAGKAYGHVIDPRTGQPVAGALLSAVILPQATDTDALSTAILVAPELMANLKRRRPDIRSLVVRGDASAPQILSQGIETF